MKLLLLFAVVCTFVAPAVHAADVPTGNAKDVPQPAADASSKALLNGLVVVGSMKQVIGKFGSLGAPGIGNTFELNLTELPKEKIEFKRTAVDPLSQSGAYPSYIPFSAPLAVEEVKQAHKVTGPGRAVINLSSISSDRKFLIQIVAEGLEKGKKVTILFYRDGGFIGSMAEAEGVFK